MSFLMAVLSANSQIVLTESNTLHSATYTQSRDYVFSNVPLPTEGADQVYDFSDMSLPTGSITAPFLPATRPGFTDYTRYLEGNTGLGPIDLTAEYYTLKDANGIYEIGTYTLPQVTPLTTITGNPNDFIEFPGNASIFSTPVNILSFPHTYETSFTANYEYSTEFELTVAAFGLAATPGENVQSVVKTVETVGYGQLILPMTGGQSIAYDVLLVKEIITTTNNVFLGGAPAPQSLLDAFGVTQGQTASFSNYLFYAENFEEAIAHFIMNEDFTEVDQMFYDMDALELDTELGIADKEFSNSLKIYPNPASDQVTIAAAFDMASNKQITFYDIYGKVVKVIEPSFLDHVTNEI